MFQGMNKYLVIFCIKQITYTFFCVKTHRINVTQDSLHFLDIHTFFRAPMTVMV